MSKKGGPLRPKFGGGNPYEKLTVFQLAKRARRGDGGSEYEADARLGAAKTNPARRSALPLKKQREMGLLPTL